VPANDDDATDDDDATADDATDDDDVVDPGPSYPDEEVWFALAVGNRWRYEETVDVGGAEPAVDDVIVQILSRRVGSSLDPKWGDDMVAFEILVDKALGVNFTHWHGIDGTGVMKWLRTVKHDAFGDQVTDGDGEVIFRLATSDPDLAPNDEKGTPGASYETGWYITDIDGFNYSAETITVGSHQLPNGVFIDVLENDLKEGGASIGTQRVRGRQGLLGFELSIGGAGIEWDVTECNVCDKVWELTQ
jgi:hypothetical protein